MSEESCFKITGGLALKGEIEISGAKNSVLPLLFSTILAEGEHIFHNAPDLTDVDMAIALLRSLGSKARREKSTIHVASSVSGKSRPALAREPVQEMRASILCLGPLLARFGEADLPLPGGCVIGARPVDFHLKGLEAMGASIKIEEGMICAKAPKGLTGKKISFSFPSVGGTENLLMAAVLAEGETVIQNAAGEPEISDLINYLGSMGAKIAWTGPRELTVQGSKILKPSLPYTVIPDRIEAGTWLLAGAITGGEVLAKKCRPEHLAPLGEKLQSCGFLWAAENNSIFLKSPAGGAEARKAAHIETGAYPGFPTDLQPQFAALMTQLKGDSSLRENVFEGRFRHIEELKKMGAQAVIKKSAAALATAQMAVLIKGPSALKGAWIKARDLRGGAGLILAGLAAEGETFVSGIRCLDRGYENLPLKLRALGASIERLPLRAGVFSPSIPPSLTLTV